MWLEGRKINGMLIHQCTYRLWSLISSFWLVKKWFHAIVLQHNSCQGWLKLPYHAVLPFWILAPTTFKLKANWFFDDSQFHKSSKSLTCYPLLMTPYSNLLLNVIRKRLSLIMKHSFGSMPAQVLKPNTMIYKEVNNWMVDNLLYPYLGFQDQCPHKYLNVLILKNCMQAYFPFPWCVQNQYEVWLYWFLGPVVYLIILGDWVYTLS